MAHKSAKQLARNRKACKIRHRINLVMKGVIRPRNNGRFVKKEVAIAELRSKLPKAA